MSRFLLILLSCIQLVAVAQNRFQKGYIVDLSGTKQACFINNKEWVNNPRKVEYRLDSNGTSLEINVKNTLEFGSNEGYVFKRAIVNVDQSSENVNSLSSSSLPEWKLDTLFLRMLVGGKARLYHLEEEGRTRFFFETDSLPISQLVYKRYLAKQSKMSENRLFINQLFSNVRCMQIPFDAGLKYLRTDLVKYFEDFNKCQGGISTNYDRLNKYKTKVYFKLAAGLSRLDLALYPKDKLMAYKPKAAVTIGYELEISLPVNKRKWSVVLEGGYQRCNFKVEEVVNYFSKYNENIHFESIDVQGGVRHYFNLNKKSRIYCNAIFYYFNPLGSKIDGRKIGDAVDFAGCLGYNYKRISGEVKYFLPRGLLNLGVYSELRMTSFILKYNLVK